MPSMAHEPRPTTNFPALIPSAISDNVPAPPPMATSASALRTIRPLRSSPRPVGTAKSTQPLAALRSSSGSRASVWPSRDLAPRQAASMTPPRPPVTTTAPAAARPAPPSPGRPPPPPPRPASCGEASPVPTTAMCGKRDIAVPLSRRWPSGPPRDGSSAHHDVDELARHDDLLDDGLAVDVGLDVGLGVGQRFELVLGRIGGRHHPVADLAVDLHDEFDGVGLQEALVG